MLPNQRLVVCLDGTWDKRDDSTNVFHHFAFVREGEEAEGGTALDGSTPRMVNQKKFYHEGVGTGVLDRITGGGFGFGLEQNVRDAYDWLVEQYNDADENRKALADEIYIFGFSRGAYTAPSLVGFIGRCGLLKRGAPLTVNQLWEQYCLIGREREERQSIWDNVFGKDLPAIHPITELVRDPWDIRPDGKTQRAKHPNATEKLLIQWSRRVKITYLGLYDTVGAIGWDALAIPGLKSKLALHHNMRPTSLIQLCRHALAIDEHRSSFNHTPFLEYMGHGNPPGLHSATSMNKEELVEYWAGQHKKWEKKIEQRWFVGAHSNVGGGYPDNELAQLPLRWVVEGATGAGLRCEEIDQRQPLNPLHPRDSYAEFAKPLWTMILRAKRNYRTIAPPRELRASRKKVKNLNDPPLGFSLKSINEKVDSTAIEHFTNTRQYRPLNLYSYFERSLHDVSGPETETKLSELRLLKPKYSWLGGNIRQRVAVVLWATLAAIGLVAIEEVVSPQNSGHLPLWLLVGIVLSLLGFILVDWFEDRMNFSIALGTTGPLRRALRDSIFWTRALGVVLFGFGLVFTLIYLWALGWKVFGPVSVTTTPPPARASFAGLLLLLEIGTAYFFVSLSWVSEAMSHAHLGSEVLLQKCWSPNAVKQRLETWRKMLACHWGKEDEDAVNGPAARAMREIVSEGLWRDMIGLIPIYSIVLGFGLWYAAEQLQWGWLNMAFAGASLWFLLPLTAAIADYVEDVCHLRYLALHAHGLAPSRMFNSYIGHDDDAQIRRVCAVLLADFSGDLLRKLVMCGPTAATGWRGIVAFSISALTALAITVIAITAAYRRLPRERKAGNPPDHEEHKDKIETSGEARSWQRKIKTST